MCKISVILPSLNVADYIEQCVESVMNQTLSDIEILCIDAGSTDGTLGILEEYEKKDNRIRILRSDKKSYGYQMNMGIKAARGEYIGIVETDDYIEPDMYEVLHHYSEDGNVEVVKGQPFYEYEGLFNSRSLPFVYVPNEIRLGDMFSPQYDPSPHLWDGNIWNGIYRTDFLIDKNIWFNETYGAAFQDIGFQQNVINAADSMMYVKEHLYHYRVIRPGNSTWNDRCLRNFYSEYRRMFVENLIPESHLIYVYGRMAPSALYELDKVLLYADYDIEKLECPEALDWLRSELPKAYKHIKYSRRLQHDDNLARLELFIEDLDAYVEELKRHNDRVREWFEPINERRAEKGTVIFGMGAYGNVLDNFLLRNGIVPVAITDNNECLWGEKWHNQKVISPNEAVEEHGNEWFVIANKNYCHDMKKQLMDKGVNERQIILMADTNLYMSMRRLPVFL